MNIYFGGKKIFIVSKQKNKKSTKIQTIPIYNVHNYIQSMICLSCSANILHMSHYTNIYNII